MSTYATPLDTYRVARLSCRSNDASAGSSKVMSADSGMGVNKCFNTNCVCSLFNTNCGENHNLYSTQSQFVFNTGKNHSLH